MRRYGKFDWGEFWARIIANIVVCFLCGWSLMIAVGIAHAEWVPTLPTIGYIPAVLVIAFLRSALYQIDWSRDRG